jgi:hypothetical protein
MKLEIEHLERKSAFTHLVVLSTWSDLHRAQRYKCQWFGGDWQWNLQTK